MGKTRVLVADEEGIVRVGLRLLLDGFPDIEVVGEVDDGAEAVAKAVLLHPDVLIIDVSRPGCRGLEAMRLSIKTVEKHRANLMAKLALRDRGDLVRFAAQAGLSSAVS